jgi:hypothetical protein
MLFASCVVDLPYQLVPLGDAVVSDLHLRRCGLNERVQQPDNKLNPERIQTAVIFDCILISVCIPKYTMMGEYKPVGIRGKKIGQANSGKYHDNLILEYISHDGSMQLYCT